MAISARCFRIPRFPRFKMNPLKRISKITAPEFRQFKGGHVEPNTSRRLRSNRSSLRTLVFYFSTLTIWTERERLKNGIAQSRGGLLRGMLDWVNIEAEQPSLN